MGAKSTRADFNWELTVLQRRQCSKTKTAVERDFLQSTGIAILFMHIKISMYCNHNSIWKDSKESARQNL